MEGQASVAKDLVVEVDLVGELEEHLEELVDLLGLHYPCRRERFTDRWVSHL